MPYNDNDLDADYDYEEDRAPLEMDDMPSKKPPGNVARGSTTELSTSTERKTGTQVDRTATTEPVAVDTFTGPIASVKVALGRTINLGNYQTARVDVSITMPCRPQDAERAYDRALQFVNERLAREIANAKVSR